MPDTKDHIKNSLQNGESPLDPDFANDLFAMVQAEMAVGSQGGNTENTPSAKASASPKISRNNLIKIIFGSLLLNVILATVVFINYSDNSQIDVLNGVTIQESRKQKSTTVAPTTKDSTSLKPLKNTQITSSSSKAKKINQSSKPPMITPTKKPSAEINIPVSISEKTNATILEETKNPTEVDVVDETKAEIPIETAVTDSLTEEERFIRIHAKQDSNQSLFIKRK